MAEPSHSGGPPWWQQVGYALMGREFAAPDPSNQTPDADAIVGWLAGHDVDRHALSAERTRCLALRLPWPHPVPGELHPELGAAQRAALLAQVQARILGAPIPHVPRPRPGTKSPHDQRLIAEKPPHHG